MLHAAVLRLIHNSMDFRFFSSPHKLSGYIECLWYTAGLNPKSQKGEKEKLLPTATVEIVFNLSRDRLTVYKDGTIEELVFPGAMVCGVHTVPFLIDSKEEDIILGVHFKPGGIFPFLQTPISNLLNSHFSLEHFWDSSAAQLRDILISSQKVQEKFDALETFLIGCFSEQRCGHPAVRELLARGPTEFDNINLEEFCSEIELSAQRFIELFKREVGLTPKVYLNITRFQDVLSKLSEEEKVNWLDISFENGFFDQAHFNKEFKRLSTMSPTHYQSKKKRNPNHVPV